jgi:hypothetical protein
LLNVFLCCCLFLLLNLYCDFIFFPNFEKWYFYLQEMVFACVMSVIATPTTLAVHVITPCMEQTDRSAMTRASMSVASVSVQTRSFKGTLWEVSDLLWYLCWT